MMFMKGLKEIRITGANFLVSFSRNFNSRCSLNHPCLQMHAIPVQHKRQTQNDNKSPNEKLRKHANTKNAVTVKSTGNFY